jgi:hypothetical protein
VKGQDYFRNRYKIEHKVADCQILQYEALPVPRLIKAKIHTLLAAIASNVKRMARLICPRIGKICPLLDRPCPTGRWLAEKRERFPEMGRKAP